MSKPSLAALVAEGIRLKTEVKNATSRLKEIEAVLIEQGAGDYADADGHQARVIQPSLSYFMPSSAEDESKVREICGDCFPKLFDRVATHKPVKGFESVAVAVLGKRVANRLLKICGSAKSAYVKWS